MELYEVAAGVSEDGNRHGTGRRRRLRERNAMGAQTRELFGNVGRFE